MTQSNQSPQVTYSLEDFLLRLEQNLDKRFESIDKRFESIDKRFESIDKRFDNLENKIDAVQKDVTDVKIGQAKLEGELKGEIKSLEAKIDGIGKRLDTQEFINRSVVVGFVLTVLASLFKLFFPNLT